MNEAVLKTYKIPTHDGWIDKAIEDMDLVELRYIDIRTKEEEDAIQKRVNLLMRENPIAFRSSKEMERAFLTDPTNLATPEDEAKLQAQLDAEKTEFLKTYQDEVTLEDGSEAIDGLDDIKGLGPSSKAKLRGKGISTQAAFDKFKENTEELKNLLGPIVAHKFL